MIIPFWFINLLFNTNHFVRLSEFDFRSFYYINNALICLWFSITDKCSEPRRANENSKQYIVFGIYNTWWISLSKGRSAMINSNGSCNVLQVHVRFWLCHDSLSCVCAVAVREGNAILGVDVCGSRSSLRSITRPKIKQYSPTDWGLSPGAFVSTDGRNDYYVSCV